MTATMTAEKSAEIKTYRGASVEELLPQIRTDLGPEAVIVSRREGLVGGVGGFFQKKCIEIDARAGGPRIDVYDEEPEPASIPEAGRFPTELMPQPQEPTDQHPVRNDAATREGLSTPAVQQLVHQASPFADLLSQANVEPQPEPEPEALPEPPKRVSSLRDGMVGTGLGADIAGEIVDSVVANVLPFSTPGRLRTLVRNELALRLPVVPAAAPGPRRLAVVGAAGTGKTAAVARLATAHAAAGQSVACFAVEAADGGAALRALLAGSGVAVETVSAEGLAPALLAERADLVVLDTPAASAGDAATIAALARTVGAVGLDEVHLAVRAGTAAPVAAEMLETLRPLGPDRILVTGAGETAYLGAAVDLALRSSLPIHYVAESANEIAPADGRALAAKVVP
jgi:flagellar biosynthesis protein FlhF